MTRTQAHTETKFLARVYCKCRTRLTISECYRFVAQAKNPCAFYTMYVQETNYTALLYCATCEKHSTDVHALV